MTGWRYHFRGRARGEKRDYDGAIADFSEAIRIDPKDSAAFRNRGIAGALQARLRRCNR